MNWYIADVVGKLRIALSVLAQVHSQSTLALED